MSGVAGVGLPEPGWVGALRRVAGRGGAGRTLGGSLVILTPFCRMSTGKAGEGYEVSHSRKFLCTTFGSISSTSFSSVIIHETNRWQFCRQTQLPLDWPPASIFSAGGPCPCPSEMASTCRPLASADLSSVSIGSTPGERMKTSGLVLVESLKEPSRSKGGGSMNFWPISALTNCEIAGTSLSCRSTRSSSSRWKGESACVHAGSWSQHSYGAGLLTKAS